jgi:ABC-type branched-subunit amino acid transport system substrate-binding protein
MMCSDTGHSEQHASQPPREDDALVRPTARRRYLWLVLLAISILAVIITAASSFLWFAAVPPVTIAVHASLSGQGSFSGQALSEAVQMAEREVNAESKSPRIELMLVDDQSSPQMAADVAERVGASNAVLVIGPSLTPAAEMAAPVYEKAGIAALVATAHGDDITRKGKTSFLITASTSDMGKALANYLRHILGKKSAVVICTSDGYGETFAAGFRSVADDAGLKVVYHTIKARDKHVAEYDEAARERREAIVHDTVSDPDQPAVIFGMTQDAVNPILLLLRRKGYEGLILGTTSLARDSFTSMFRSEPEEKKTPGFFTDGVYAASPVMLDSANAATLTFARRFRAFYLHEPSWEAVQSYDALKLAAEAISAVSSQSDGTLAPSEMRKELLDYFNSSGAALTAKSLSSGVWLQEEHRRQQSLRIGRYQGRMFKSALVQLVPIPGGNDNQTESGLVDLGGGHYARRQQVVYTGIQLIEIPHLNITQPSFTADFYLWMRYSKPETSLFRADAEINPNWAKDLAPENIDFLDAIQGLEKTELQSKESNGISYRLWHVRGEFKNNLDFHHFPLDSQILTLRFVHKNADSSHIAYIRDQDETTVPEFEPFRNLTQWNAIRISQQRYASLTRSDLGSEQRSGLDQGRELSGYNLTVELHRSVISAVTKTMLPLAVMTLIMWASLFFPHSLVKETVMVVITVALSGTVLLSSINSQLGDVGYILAVEYVFYLFFVLCLLSIVGVLAAERLRSAERKALARKINFLTRTIFALAIVAAAGTGWLVSEQWQEPQQSGFFASPTG